MSDLARNFLSKFNRFEKNEIELILQNTCIENFNKGDKVIQAGKVCQKCYWVAAGCLRQFKDIDGTEKTIQFFLEGEPVVIYASYLENKPSEYSVECLEDAVLISGTKEQENQMIKSHPNIANLLQGIMFDDYKKSERYIKLLNCYNPEERYLMLVKSNPEILKRIPLIYISSYIGVTPESLSRIRKRVTSK